MKIVIAPDSFKENLTSLQVAQAIEKGIRRVIPGARVVTVPMADGGEGTVQSLVDATAGKMVRKKVTGPLGDPVTARYGMLGDGVTAVIEMAEASGLPLVPKDQRNPLLTTTYGTGELIIDALNRGAEKIILGLGGSATTDGGSGMAQAIGVRFLDQSGQELKQPGCGGMLASIASIDISGVDKRIRANTIIIASDVDNPLCGKKGAAHVFGPQKGADPAMVKLLDANLKHYGQLIKKTTGRDVSKLAGAGAAGGLGAGLVGFARAKLKSGIDIVVDVTGLDKYLKGADLVITGEGRVDFQTVFGKTPSGVAKAAKKHKVPVVAIGGGLADDAAGVFAHGIHGLESAVSRDMTIDEALKNSRDYLANAGERTMRMLLIGQQIQKKKTRRTANKK